MKVRSSDLVEWIDKPRLLHAAPKRHLFQLQLLGSDMGFSSVVLAPRMSDVRSGFSGGGGRRPRNHQIRPNNVVGLI